MLPNGVFVSGTGPAVIFLHSSLSSSRQWFSLVKHLEGCFTCINIDILGYGAADGVKNGKNYSFNDEVTRINDVIDTVVGKAGYHLVGHSCGGAIALKLAVEAPQRVLSLSLFEPVAFHLLPKGSELRELSDSFAEQVNIEDTYEAAEIFTNFWNKEGFFAALPAKMQAFMAADMPKVVLDFQGIMAESYTLNDISNIKAPSLLLTGGESPELSQYLAGQIVANLPNVKQQTIAAGHMAPISHGELTLPIIAEFIMEYTEQ